MKKFLFGLVVIITMIFLYQYQSPIMSTGEAIIQAEEYLQHPPKEWKNSISYIDLKEIPSGNINTSLKPKNGFWNELTNKKQWEVTIKYNGTQPTIIMDAYTGKFINLSGPLN